MGLSPFFSGVQSNQNWLVMIAPEVLEAAEECKPLPKRLHSIVQQRIIALLVRELGLDVALPELAVGVLDAERKQIVPDVVVVHPGAQYERGVLTNGAVAAVEIMSPEQSFAGMVDKCERMLISGIVPVCWLLWPEHTAAYTFDLRRGLFQEATKLGFTYDSRNVVLALTDILGNLPTEP